MRLYHYTDKPFNAVDMEKCDGFWMTDIEPSDTEMLDEIGAQSQEWVAICELHEGEELRNASNYEVASQLTKSAADYICNDYDVFTDYAVADASKVKIIEWVKL